MHAAVGGARGRYSASAISLQRVGSFVARSDSLRSYGGVLFDYLGELGLDEADKRSYLLR